MAKSKLGLTRDKVKKLEKLIREYPQQEAAALAGIPPRSYSRYKSLGREIFDDILNEDVDEDELDEAEKLLLDFYIAVDTGVPLHVGKYYKIIRDSAFGEKVYTNADGERRKTDWLAAKEYAHMLTFATKEARDERETDAPAPSGGSIEVPISNGDPSDFFRSQQQNIEKLVEEKRKENGDHE